MNSLGRFRIQKSKFNFNELKSMVHELECSQNYKFDQKIAEEYLTSTRINSIEKSETSKVNSLDIKKSFFKPKPFIIGNAKKSEFSKILNETPLKTERITSGYSKKNTSELKDQKKYANNQIESSNNKAKIFNP